MTTIVIGGSQKLAARRRAMPSIKPIPLFIGLAELGVLTEEETFAAAALGQLPVEVEDALAEMSSMDRLKIRITLARAQEIDRAHPFVDLLAAAKGMTPEQVDALFQTLSSAT